ncbi:hypothetical protein AC578_7055 [Pseudocercospora eumusae]|uniref:Brix domain-containing protein n=1 Tax=Pseudocercospora eumusae TaxID=321146 RepID=A0A139GWS1_9PEZI|nr:hypothetical protein AC578_7055 [Pseudocercospora eumusae]
MATVYRSVSKSKPSTDSNPQNAEPKPKNKQRVLILTSRGVTYRHRHLLGDLNSLLPHSRKDAKLDTKTQLHQLNELADLYNCNNVMFFEARKAKDLYIWLSKPPNGPTVKMHCQNIHTMEELNFTGNCLKGSRPILSFDATFEKHAHMRLIKELLTHTFGVPKTSRKIKPFTDHVMGFTIADGKIWIRCYQISETEQAKGKSAEEKNEDGAAAAPSKVVSKLGKGETHISLVEIGPRFVLTPIVILEGSFGGPVIYENKEFVSPNQIRSDLRRAKAGRYNKRAEGELERKVKRRDLGLRTGEGKREIDELDNRVVFA